MTKNYFVKDSDPTWKDADTLEAAIRKAFTLGLERELLPVIESLPEARKAFYREVWAEETKRRKAS